MKIVWTIGTGANCSCVLNCVFQKDILKSLFLVPQNVTFFRNEPIADIIR